MTHIDKPSNQGIAACKLLEWPAFPDPRGTLSFLESGKHVPFEIRRIFYMYDVPAGVMRAGHALTRCEQCVIAIAGRFDISVDDGFSKAHYRLDQRNTGLYVPPMIWRELVDFSDDAVCLVLASEPYDAADYVDDYTAFLRGVGAPAR